MPGPFSTVAYNTLSTYVLLVGAGIVLSITFCAWALRDVARPGQVVDAGIGGLFCGLISARAVHVLLQWEYFSLHRPEITQLDAGGLDWRGAVIGVVVGVMIIGKLRGLPLSRLFDALAVCLPLIGVLAWVGNGAIHAAYGAEVDNLTNYPVWLVWEERDIFNTIAPRYATQRIGAVLMIGLLLLALTLHMRGWLHGRRAPFILALTAAVMFGIGFLRGDFAVMVGGLRQGQWLDLLLLLSGVIGLLWRSKQRPNVGIIQVTAP